MHRLIFGTRLSSSRIGSPGSALQAAFGGAPPVGGPLKAEGLERLRKVGDEAVPWYPPQAHPFGLRVLRQKDLLLRVGLQNERDRRGPPVVVYVVYERTDSHYFHDLAALFPGFPEHALLSGLALLEVPAYAIP